MKKVFLFSSLALALGMNTAMADTYVFDADHTQARFELRHFGASQVLGGFYNLEGEIEFNDGKGDLTLEIPADTIETGIEGFNQHLKSDDLFNVEKYDTIKFKANDIKLDDEKLNDVKGELTIIDQTHPITLTVDNFSCYESPMFDGAQVCGGTLTTTIDRTQWGLDLFAGPVAKEVDLKIQVEAVKQ